MDEYQKEQFATFQELKSKFHALTDYQKSELQDLIKPYLLFRQRTALFLDEHFKNICTQKCYSNHLSACCSKNGIIVYFADMIVQFLMTDEKSLCKMEVVIQKPAFPNKCIYLNEKGCIWDFKPIICEMFLCPTAISQVMEKSPYLKSQWQKIQSEKKSFMWPDQPVLFDQLEMYFMKLGLNSPLMYLNNSPGLLRLKKQSQLKKIQ